MWNNRKSDYCPNCGAKMDGVKSISTVNIRMIFAATASDERKQSRENVKDEMKGEAT